MSSLETYQLRSMLKSRRRIRRISPLDLIEKIGEEKNNTPDSNMIIEVIEKVAIEAIKTRKVAIRVREEVVITTTIRDSLMIRGNSRKGRNQIMQA